MRKLSWLLILAMVLAICPCASAAGDIYASGTTLITDHSSNKMNNIALACEAISGTVINYGEQFSFNDIVGPRSAEAGYLNATNGRGVKVRGGGVAQVAATLWLAVSLLDDIQINEKHVYGKNFTDTYVASGDDAIVTDYSAGSDFIFTNYYGKFVIYLDYDEYNIYCTLEDPDGSAFAATVTAKTVVEKSGQRRGNIALAAETLDGIVLETGDVFSFNDIVGPRTAEAGYANALNGRGVKVRGGGVGQVASTLYLALKKTSCFTMLEKHVYGKNFSADYVTDLEDAIVVDYANNQDFSFRYTGYDAVIIHFTLSGTTLTCTIEEYEGNGSHLPVEEEIEKHTGHWESDGNGNWIWVP